LSNFKAKKSVNCLSRTVFYLLSLIGIVSIFEVEGIGPARHQKITQAWTDQRVIRTIMVFLHSHGVSKAVSTFLCSDRERY